MISEYADVPHLLAESKLHRISLRISKWLKILWLLEADRLFGIWCDTSNCWGDPDAEEIS